MEENKSFKSPRKPAKDGVFTDRDKKAFLKAKKFKLENGFRVKGGEEIMTYRTCKMRDTGR